MSLATRESLIRSLDTGLLEDGQTLYYLVHEPEQLQVSNTSKRIYTRIIKRCGQCHCMCRGTMFKPSVCSQTGAEVKEFGPIPNSCPLPLV